MSQLRPQVVTVDDHAIDHLLHYCRENGRPRLFLVADPNTYAAKGQAVANALSSAGFDLRQVILTKPEVIADGEHVFEVMRALDPVERTFIAVGSGPITDITRFVSHRTRSGFISIPTAPSVDGFTSIGAPMIIDGVKKTVYAHAPNAIFADLHTLCAAPQAMIAAGFGDMLGKYTSIADWRLGRILWDEPFDASIAQRTLDAVQLCADNAAGVGRADPDAVRILFDALVESGYCMLDFGQSRPASGTEHHYSHFWEMKLLHEGRPAILHGAKVGVATVLVAGLYDQVRQFSREQVAHLLEESELPDRGAEEAAIRKAYGAEGDEVIRDQAHFLELTPAKYAEIKQRILDHWDDIQAIAAQVPPAVEVAHLLRQAGGPTTVAEIGLSQEEQELAIAYGHYLRDRFTVRKLMRMLGMP
ncbi:MAG: sn-glycerol-1-phosphate dehydrogenase [Anaerolineales bacterium]|nr:sn-glycerol-1-phosphate dehydrogenase [Anaerolineales bacterium]